MLPQWPWVVWATTLQFPSNGEAIAAGVEKKVAEAAAKATAKIRLPIMGVLLFPEGDCSATIGWQGRMKAASAFLGRPREVRICHNMQSNIAYASSDFDSCRA